MANRSYLYTVDPVTSGVELGVHLRVAGVAEYNYDIPLAFMLLVSGYPRRYPSLLWEPPAEAIIGDYDLGIKRLLKFLDQVSHPEIGRLKKLSLDFLTDESRRQSYFLLEAQEVFELGGWGEVDPTGELLESLSNLSPVVEKKLAAFRDAEISGEESTAAELLRSLGITEWSDELYYSPKELVNDEPAEAMPSSNDRIEKLLAELFSKGDRQRVLEMIAPLGDLDGRLPEYVVRLSRGRLDLVAHYLEEAKQDYRNIIFWVENPEESRIDTPEKVDELQEMLEWSGLERDHELDQYREQLVQLEQRPVQRREGKSLAEGDRPVWFVPLVLFCVLALVVLVVAAMNDRSGPPKKELPWRSADQESLSVEGAERSEVFSKLYGVPYKPDAAKGEGRE